MVPTDPDFPITDVAAAARLFADLVDDLVEVAAVAYLDPKWRLLGITRFAGTRRSVAPSLRRIVREALEFDAAAAILAHSHLGSDATPSTADLAYTRKLAATLRSVGIALVDHLILAGDTVVSLRDRGLL